MGFQPPCVEQMNANATHYGILAAMIAKTTGPVLELGVGHYSTPLIHFMCQRRNALSVDTSHEWFVWFAKEFKRGSHQFYCTQNRLISEDFFKAFKRKHWDVAFVDNNPSVDRVKCVEKLRNRAKFIVVHDSEPRAVAYGWGDVFDTFKYRFYWDFYHNGTTVVSDVEEIGLV